MGASTGITVMQNYAGAANNAARLDLLAALIPNTDVSPAQAGGSVITQLDEMSPIAAAQLSLEIAACKAALT